jgi:hypothetical protein
MTTHGKIVISCGALILAMVAGRSAAPSTAEPNAAVQGVWRTLEVVVPGAAGRTFKPEATLAIFHGRHYSRVEVHAEQPRPTRRPRPPTSCARSGVPSWPRRAPSK